MTLEPDRDQLEVFIQAIFRHAKQGFVSLRAFMEGEDKTFRISTVKVLDGNLKFLCDVAEDDARRAAQFPKPVVFCPPLATFNNKDRAREIDIAEGLALSVECDKNPDAAGEQLERLLGPATVAVRSGGIWTNGGGQSQDKIHLHWRLAKPASGKAELAKLKHLRDIATRLVGGDPTNISAVHPIRWPGSWHRKAEPRLCEIITVNPNHELDLDAALLLFGTPPDKDWTARAPHVAPSDNVHDERGRLDWSAAFGQIISGASYHPTLTPLAASFAAYGIPEAFARKLLDAVLVNSRPSDPDRERRRETERSKLKSTVASAYAKFKVEEPPPHDGEGIPDQDPRPHGAVNQASPDWQKRPGAYTDYGADDPPDWSQVRPQPPPPTWVFDPWERYIVPAFPLDVLPADLGDFVGNQAAIVGGDMSAMAMSALATLSGALDHRSALRMMRNGDWWASPSLWVLLVGMASYRKTPIITATARALMAQDARVQREYQRRLREWEKLTKEEKEGNEKPEPPKRYVVNDTTVEKLGEILARSPSGLLVKADEAAGWLGSMERYSNNAGASDRAFWLQAYDGGPYTIDRIKRGEIFVENLSVSIIGGIQPARLAELHKLSTDGLLQRFLPVMMGTPSLPEDRDYKTDRYDVLVREMYLARPARLIMTDGALVRMEIIRRGLFDLEQATASLAPGLESFVGKLHGVCGSLALILHMVADPKQTKAAVDENTIERVERLVWGFILPHAYEFYRFSPAGDQLRSIASWILTSGLTRIVPSDLSRNVATLRGLGLVEVNQRLSPLIAGGWLHPEDKTPVCRAWQIAPQVRQQLAERARVEDTNKAALARLMGSPRK